VGRASPAEGLTVLGGFAIGENGHDSYRVSDFRMFAAALRYVRPLGDRVSLAVTGGGWYARDGSVSVSRAYLNGTADISVDSHYSGHDRYFFGRLTLGWRA